jgi:gliding motility-associated-like protein
MSRAGIIIFVFLFGLSLRVYCLTGNGNCSVSAKYSPGNDTVISMGNPIFFENQSLNSSSFAWYLNGVFTSSQKDFTLNPALGVNEIMLVSSDGICSDTSFSFIIWDGIASVQYENFQKQYHPTGMAMEPFCMAIDRNKGYLFAGDYYLPDANNFISKTTCLVHIDGKGCVNWAKAMISGEVEVIQSIISTGDSGYLVSAFPYQSQQSNYPNYLIVFKLDKSGNMEWSHSFSDGSTVNNYYSAICETSDNGFSLEIGSFPVAGNPSFMSVIKIDRLGRFVWGRKLSAENNSFYNIGGITGRDQFLYATGSIYDGAPPYDVIRSFLVKLDEATGQTIWTMKNDPGQPPLSFTDIHEYKNGLLINSYSGNLLNNFMFCDMNGNVTGSAVVNNPYGSLNGKENIIVTPDNGLYFHQASGMQAFGCKDIIMRLDSNLRILWQYDFSAKDLDFTGWFQLSAAPDFGLAGIGSGLLPGGVNALTFIKLDSAGSGCNSGFTSLQLATTHAAMLPMTWSMDNSFTMSISDLPVSLDEISIESRLFCPKYMNGCDLLKLEGPRVVCQPGDTIGYRLHYDPFCTEGINWTYDQQLVNALDSSQSGRSFRFLKPGEFVIRVEKNGCNRVVDSIIVSVGNDIPKINLPVDTVLCFGSTMKLDAGNGYESYLWQDGTDKESIDVAGPGVYWVKLTGKNGCISTDSTLIDSIVPLPFSFLPADTVICASEFYELRPSFPFKSYLWNTGETSGSIQIADAGLYILGVVDGSGCEGSDSIRVETKKCPFGIYFPNAFTPNRDGLNDIFQPVIIGKPSIYKLSIYNRWGQQIFETTNPGQGWNGMVKNSELESGTYIWTCTYQFNSQGKMIRKGSFLLLR